MFVLTHQVADDDLPPGSLRYATDVGECATQARASAGDRDVLLLGAGAGQALLRAGEVDEIQVHVVPVLLGQGRRLFDGLPTELVELELVRHVAADDVQPSHQALHLRYRVVRGEGAA